MRWVRTYLDAIAHYAALLFVFALLAPLSFTKPGYSGEDAALYGERIAICSIFGITYIDPWSHDDAPPGKVDRPHCPACQLLKTVNHTATPAAPLLYMATARPIATLPPLRTERDMRDQITERHAPTRAPPAFS